jgi:hypothetical protein
MTLDPLPRVRVSENGRFLVTETGEPFFWLGDTAWELFHRLTREEAALYLADRQRKRFNVVQAVVLAETDGLNVPNTYGERPLLDNDPARPNEAYFAYVDELVQMAAAHGLYVGLLPTWGDKVTRAWGVGPVVFDEGNARAYGHFLGERYRDQTNVLWILGGDRPALTEETDYRPIWRAMAAGIDEATDGVALMTYHPMGGHSTSEWLHDEAWLDVHMMQSGHGGGRDTPVWEMVARDYDLRPSKPTLDGEPNYEDHPVSPWPTWDPANGYFRDYDVRKQVYRSVFAGGCGVTYGHHSIWQMYTPDREPITYPERDWIEALDRPGAQQVQHLRALIESRPFLTRIPDQSVLVSDPGQGSEHVRATRDESATYALVYLPTARGVTVSVGVLSGASVKAWWYDPRTGGAISIGEYPAEGARTFTPPADGPDWVLVLDDATQEFEEPGRGNCSWPES